MTFSGPPLTGRSAWQSRSRLSRLTAMLPTNRLMLLVQLASASYPLLIEARDQVGSDLHLIFEHKMA
jgi:hypothetical protein